MQGVDQPDQNPACRMRSYARTDDLPEGEYVVEGQEERRLMKLFSTRISLTIDSLELGEVSHRSLIEFLLLPCLSGRVYTA